MIEPVLRDQAFLNDVFRQRRNPDGFRLWWLGQSGFLLQWKGKHLLFDPYLSDSLTRKYANTDKPHVRMSARVISPEGLDFVDIVTSSHNHTDHLDGETLKPILRMNRGVVLVVPEANRNFAAERLAVSPESLLGIDAGASFERFGFTLTGIPAAHETVERDQYGRCLYLGYLVQFGQWSVYHSGDTVWSDEIIHALRGRPIDLALLPINGSHPSRRVAGNLNGQEAAALGKVLGVGCVIPCHYEMFEFNTASPDGFVQAAQDLSQKVCVLKGGECYSVEAKRVT